MAAQRRTPSLYLLSLPRPPLSAAANDSSPLTPINQQRSPLTFSPARYSRASSESWNSTDDGSTESGEWDDADVQVLAKTLDNLPSHILTPFIGQVPPANLLDKLARGILSKNSDWPHTHRATRLMLAQLARQMAPSPLDMVHEDPQQAEEETKRRPEESRKRPLYRKNSMDFLPPATSKENVQINRLSTRLQRTERFFPFHPYSKCASSSQCQVSPPSQPSAPTPPSTSRRPVAPGLQRSLSAATSSASSESSYAIPALPSRIPRPTSPTSSLSSLGSLRKSNYVPHPASSAAPSASREPQGSVVARPLKALATVSEMDVQVVYTHPHLKRAPSYGVIAHQKKEAVKAERMDLDSPSPVKAVDTKPKKGSDSSDEEEKKRQKVTKRAKVLHRKPSYLGEELKVVVPVQEPAPRIPTYPKVKQLTRDKSMESLGTANSTSSSASVSTDSLMLESAATSRTSLNTAVSSTSQPIATNHSRKERSITPPSTAKPSYAKSPQQLVASPMSTSDATPPKQRTLRRVGAKMARLSEECSNATISIGSSSKSKAKGIEALAEIEMRLEVEAAWRKKEREYLKRENAKESEQVVVGSSGRGRAGDQMISVSTVRMGDVSSPRSSQAAAPQKDKTKGKSSKRPQLRMNLARKISFGSLAEEQPSGSSGALGLTLSSPFDEGGPRSNEKALKERGQGGRYLF